MSNALLGPAEVRELAARLGVSPTKRLGQNFVVDANTVRRIVAASGVGPTDVVLEIGPGLGSLTLGLLGAARRVIAVEVDPVLADALPATVAEHAPQLGPHLRVIDADALRLHKLPESPTACVANLPYNIAVPVLLHVLETFGDVRHGLVMVQSEVADRLVAAPGSRTYGVPSVKLAWYASVRRAGSVPAAVFWPVPRVESGLVAFTRRPRPATAVSRTDVFAVVDAAFGQRRKTLRGALTGWAGSAAQAESRLRRAGVDPGLRGERLELAQFVAIAEQGRAESPTGP